MPLKLRPLLAFSLPIFLSSCFFEATGCTDDICFSTGQDTCADNDCQEELHCEDSDLIEQRLAEIISTARNKARRCGQDSFSQAGVVYWNQKLAHAARKHSVDMASNNFLSHTGSDGGTVVERTTNAGYDYRVLAENIAGGQQSSTAAVNAWLNSSGHCANIMSPELKEIGAACVRDLHADYETYWTLVLAAPKTP